MRHSPDIMEILCSVQLGKNHTKKDFCDTLFNLKVIRAVSLTTFLSITYF